MASERGQPQVHGGVARQRHHLRHVLHRHLLPRIHRGRLLLVPQGLVRQGRPQGPRVHALGAAAEEHCTTAGADAACGDLGIEVGEGPR